MNISLPAAGKKKQKKGGSSLAFGLNSRKKTTSNNNNVFGDDGDSSDNDSDDGANQRKSRRQVVNEQIAREQAASRGRAQAALASAKDATGVYDYDGAYDSFHPTEESKTKPEAEEKKSKYIGDLLKAAKVRDRERDAIYERRNAKEQAEEDANADFRGKEKFVTKSYKRKLQERKQWEAEQEQKEREEEANDVTKKAAGSAFAGFYGNLNRSTMTEQKAKSDEDLPNDSVDRNEENSTEEKVDIKLPDDDDFDPRQGFLGGFERSSKADANDAKNDENKTVVDDNEVKVPKLSMREIREKKVVEARLRYLKRMQENGGLNQ